ncbi:MAG TPA: hypothetical protein PLI18_08030 [Pirellulaceae bacterium]|nr:hypothetical protein [Pirellulaceae bacterium]
MSDLPRFLLFVEATPETDAAPGRWRFSLEGIETDLHLEADDPEPGAGLPRLELLALVRGLEALDQPSRVTLVTSSRTLGRGLRTGLTAWRESDWQWERFGEMTPIKDADLWQRVDAALKFHQISSRTFRLDTAHAPGPPHRSSVPRRIDLRDDSDADRVDEFGSAELTSAERPLFESNDDASGATNDRTNDTVAPSRRRAAKAKADVDAADDDDSATVERGPVPAPRFSRRGGRRTRYVGAG